MFVAEIVHDGNDDAAYELRDQIMQVGVLYEDIDECGIKAESYEHDDEVCGGLGL